MIGVLLFLLSAAAVLTSALGPLLVRAVHQSTLGDALTLAGPDKSSITVSLELQRGDSLDPALADVAKTFSGVVQGPDHALWRPPTLDVETTSNVGWRRAGAGGDEFISRVNAAEANCSRLVLIDGECPRKSGQGLLSVGDAAKSAARVGSTLKFALPTSRVTRLDIVGIYDPDRSMLSGFSRPGNAGGQLAQVTADPLVTTREQLSALQLGASITGRLQLAGEIRVPDIPAARQSINAVKAATSAVEGRLLIFDSQLPALLDGVDRSVSSAAVLILVTAVQAEFVAFFALVIVLQRLGHARSAEWGIGRLRGMPWRRWLLSIWSEPALALVLGVPAGFASAIGAGSVIVGRSLRPGTPVGWERWPVWTAAAACGAAALLTLIAVSFRHIRRPLIELVQQAAESRRLSLIGAVAQSGVLLLAAAALYQLLTGGVLNGTGSQLGLLAPALFALASAIIAVRVAVAVVRRVTTRPPRSLAGLIVGRHAARTPSTLNPAMVVAAGLALAVFSTQVLALSVRNQGLRAQAIVGAQTVLQVARPAGADLVERVRRADPTGRYAMAVAEKAASADGGTSRIVAVDSTRLAAVAPWTAAWVETGDVSTALHPTTVAPIILRGTQVELTVSSVALKTSRGPYATDPPGPPELSLIVDSGGAWQTVPFGPLTAGATKFTADLLCTSGCRLVGIDLYSGKGQAYQTRFTVTQLSTDTIPATAQIGRLTLPGSWRERIGQVTGPDRPESLTAAPTAAGLQVSASDTDGDNHNRAVPTDTDDPIPALVGPDLSPQPFPGKPSVAFGTGLDGQSQLLKVVGRAAILPRSLNDGVLVDLRDAAGLSDPAADEAVDEVWLSPSAPPAIEQALAGQGVQILSRQLLSDTRHELLQQGTTRGATVAVWIAFAALLVTALTLIGGRAVDGSRRRADWAALADAGQQPNTLRRLACIETAVPALLGALLGVASGIAAVIVAAPRLPLVDVFTPGPPLDLALAWTPIAWLSLGTVVVILAVAAWVAVSETHRVAE